MSDRVEGNVLRCGPMRSSVQLDGLQHPEACSFSANQAHQKRRKRTRARACMIFTCSAQKPASRNAVRAGARVVWKAAAGNTANCDKFCENLRIGEESFRCRDIISLISLGFGRQHCLDCGTKVQVLQQWLGRRMTPISALAQLRRKLRQSQVNTTTPTCAPSATTSDSQRTSTSAVTASAPRRTAE